MKAYGDAVFSAENGLSWYVKDSLKVALMIDWSPLGHVWFYFFFL